MGSLETQRCNALAARRGKVKLLSHWAHHGRTAPSRGVGSFSLSCAPARRDPTALATCLAKHRDRPEGIGREAGPLSGCVRHASERTVVALPAVNRTLAPSVISGCWTGLSGVLLQELPGGTKKHRIDLDRVSQRWKLPSGEGCTLPRLTKRPSHSRQPSAVSKTVSPSASTSARQSFSLQQLNSPLTKWARSDSVWGRERVGDWLWRWAGREIVRAT